MQCPDCKQALDTETVNKVEIDRCSGCSGIWLDKGELDKLVDARDRMTEFNTLEYDSGVHGDQHPKRSCPKCRQTMQKVDLAKDSGIIFDYCKACQGFWLDKGELAQTRKYMAQLKGDTNPPLDKHILVGFFNKMGDASEYF